MFGAGLMLASLPVFDIVISGSRAQWRKSVDAPTIPSSVPVLINFTINAGIEVQSNSTSVAALHFDQLAGGSTVRLTNNGFAIGDGGNGGDGASGGPGFAGGAGGDAVRADYSGSLIVTNINGRLWGGGGGGGGGGAGRSIITSEPFSTGGGGGGGGAGGGAAGTGGTGEVGGPAGNGTAGTTGSLGDNGVGGAGGIGNDIPSGNGGNGGDYGVAGSNGTTGQGAGGAGGASGNAIRHNAGTSVSFISGSGSPNVLGPVGT